MKKNPIEAQLLNSISLIYGAYTHFFPQESMHWCTTGFRLLLLKGKLLGRKDQKYNLFIKI
jgi:hypothetical protein